MITLQKKAISTALIARAGKVDSNLTAVLNELDASPDDVIATYGALVRDWASGRVAYKGDWKAAIQSGLIDLGASALFAQRLAEIRYEFAVTLTAVKHENAYKTDSCRGGSAQTIARK
jgi:hypothetical protein